MFLVFVKDCGFIKMYVLKKVQYSLGRGGRRRGTVPVRLTLPNVPAFQLAILLPERRATCETTKERQPSPTLKHTVYTCMPLSP